MDIGRFEDRGSMERASERFVALMGGKTVEPQNIAGEGRLPCGHPLSRGRLVNGVQSCRTCEPRARGDHAREQRLPAMVENTRTKLDHLLAECKRRGVIL